jgi:hypothetical protein
MREAAHPATAAAVIALAQRALAACPPRVPAMVASRWMREPMVHPLVGRL